MWLLRDTPALFTDLYELTMSQVYFRKQMNDTAWFEVSIRRLPEHWGFFVMAGLAEAASYLSEFRFSKSDLDYLGSTHLFSDDFLTYLSNLKLKVRLRALPEGTVFFPHEPVLEVEVGNSGDTLLIYYFELSRNCLGCYAKQSAQADEYKQCWTDAT